MPRAVRFDNYGGIDVLQVVEVGRPLTGPGQVLVRVKAAGINPGEASIRKGLFAERWPSTFPSGQGSDLAGVVEEIGAGVAGVHVGDEIIGFTEKRASQAELVVIESTNLVPRPANVPWEQAGALVVISGAAGGVGTIAVQLAVNAGAKVIGLASDRNHQWLKDHSAVAVTYGDGVEDRIRSASGGKVDALIDTFGGGYVELALKLGVPPERIDTIIDFAAAEKYKVKAEGNSVAATPEVLGELVDMMAAGRLVIPIAKVYPLADVQEAYRDLEQRHTQGKIVLKP